MRNLSTSLSRTLDTSSKQLTNEYAQRSELIHNSIDSIVDQLHGQVKVDTEVKNIFYFYILFVITYSLEIYQSFANNFSKVYSAASVMLQENREKVRKYNSHSIYNLILIFSNFFLFLFRMHNYFFKIQLMKIQ